MLRTSNHKRSLQVMVMVLAVLLVGITATGYGDDGFKTDDRDDGHFGLSPTEQLSGPALTGMLTVSQSGADAFVVFFGQCRGIDVFFVTPVSGFTVATTTARSLKGLRLIGMGPPGCLTIDGSGGEDLIVTKVQKRTFVNDGTTITAEVELLHVVPRLDQDKDEDKDNDKDKDK